MIKSDTNDYTKHYIAEALFKLMQKKDFRDISITEITKKAGVCRATYYRNFTDKESVLRYYFNQAQTDFTLNQRYLPRCDEDYYEMIIVILQTLKEKKDFVQMIQKSHLEYLYLDYLNENFLSDFENSNKPQNPFLPFAYAGLLYNISMQWLKTDCTESIDTVAEALFISCFSAEKYAELLAKMQCPT